MKMQSRLGRNTLWIFSSRFGTQGLMVLFTILLARRMGSDGFGEYAFIAATIFLGNILTTFGTDMLLIREIAAQDDLSRLPESLVIQLVLSAVFIAGVFVIAPFLPNQSPQAMLALEVYSLSLFPLAFFTVFTTALRGKQKMDAYTVLSLAIAILQLALAWVFIRPGENIVTMSLVLLVTQLIAAGLAGVACTLMIPEFWRTWRFSVNKVPVLVRMSAPMALLGLLGMSYQKLSIYMLSFMQGAQITGWFSAALRVVEASKIIHLAAFTALYPAMAQVQAEPGKEDHSSLIFKWSWRLLLGTAVVIAIVLFIIAGPVIRLLYGIDYGESVIALKILIWILIPYTISTYLSLAYLAAGGEYWVTRAMSVGLFSLAILEAWMIPTWGLAGACLAAVLAETVQMVVYLVPLRNQDHRITKRVYKLY